jgi:hypothetical protein
MLEPRRHVISVLIDYEKICVREVQSDLMRTPERRRVGSALTEVEGDVELSSTEENQDCSFSVLNSVTRFLSLHEHHVFFDYLFPLHMIFFSTLGPCGASPMLSSMKKTKPDLHVLIHST